MYISSDDYGMDYDGPVPVVDDSGVIEVSPTLPAISSYEVDELTRSIDPLCSSSNFGMDIYLQVQHFLVSRGY